MRVVPAELDAPILYGASYSVYVRIVRLVLHEKGVPYRHVEVDIFGKDAGSADYLRLHPFGRIPVLAHGDFHLYETAAIARYVDEAFDGPSLQPAVPRDRARMNQIIGLLDSYAYRTLVWDIFVERIRAPANGRTPDEDRIAEALPKADTCLKALEDLGDGEVWLAGPSLTLADLHAIPMFVYFLMTPEGAGMMERYPRLSGWWRAVEQRASVAATRSPME